MKLKKLIALLAVIVSLLNLDIKAQSQDNNDIINKYETKTIYLNGTMTEYTLNNKTHRVGYFARFIKHEFDSCSSEAQLEISSCVKLKKRGSLLLSSGSVILIGALVVMPLAVGPLALGAVVVGLVPYTIGTLKLNLAQDKLHKAIWLHNRDVLKR